MPQPLRRISVFQALSYLGRIMPDPEQFDTPELLPQWALHLDAETMIEYLVHSFGYGEKDIYQGLDAIEKGCLIINDREGSSASEESFRVVAMENDGGFGCCDEIWCFTLAQLRGLDDTLTKWGEGIRYKERDGTTSLLLWIWTEPEEVGSVGGLCS